MTPTPRENPIRMKAKRMQLPTHAAEVAPELAPAPTVPDFIEPIVFERDEREGTEAWRTVLTADVVPTAVAPKPRVRFDVPEEEQPRHTYSTAQFVLFAMVLLGLAYITDE